MNPVRWLVSNQTEQFFIIRMGFQAFLRLHTRFNQLINLRHGHGRGVLFRPDGIRQNHVVKLSMEKEEHDQHRYRSDDQMGNRKLCLQHHVVIEELSSLYQVFHFNIFSR